MDLRVSIGLGTKPYGTFRVSVVAPASDKTAPALTVDGRAADWQYSEQFKYKWTDNALHTKLFAANGTNGTNVTVAGVASFTWSMPKPGVGVAAVLIADPCLDDASIITRVGCTYGKRFKTSTRTPALLNAFVGDQPDAIDFWGILG